MFVKKLSQSERGSGTKENKMEIQTGETVAQNIAISSTVTQNQKTVTFCCNFLQQAQQNTCTVQQDNDALAKEKNSELNKSIKIQRNKVRSSQRAHEQRAYLRLKELVPSLSKQHKRISKLETLKQTCEYIKYLKEILDQLNQIKAEREKKRAEEEEMEMQQSKKTAE